VDDRLQQALLFAAHAHDGQWREGPAPLPYVCHPVEVAAFLRHVGGVDDPELLCAALLHDVIEATGRSEAEIRDAFGRRVSRMVRAMTRSEPSEAEASGLSPGQLWELRAALLVEDVARMDPEAWPIKLADRLSNVREARRLKKGRKLERYLLQTRRILAVVPPRANPGLWDAVAQECEAGA
jgi:guanosine-3',5'-bis(diphosphate) 3'-pyrophosphohydrolase